MPLLLHVLNTFSLLVLLFSVLPPCARFIKYTNIMFPTQWKRKESKGLFGRLFTLFSSKSDSGVPKTFLAVNHYNLLHKVHESLPSIISVFFLLLLNIFCLNCCQFQKCHWVLRFGSTFCLRCLALVVSDQLKNSEPLSLHMTGELQRTTHKSFYIVGCKQSL